MSSSIDFMPFDTKTPKEVAEIRRDPAFISICMYSLKWGNVTIFPDEVGVYLGKRILCK